MNSNTSRWSVENKTMNYPAASRRGIKWNLFSPQGAGNLTLVRPIGGLNFLQFLSTLYCHPYAL